MSEPHDLAFLCLGADLKTGRQRLPLHEERVITSRLERVEEMPEDRSSVMVDHGNLSMHQPPRAHDLASERLPDRLMAQTDPQDRDLAGKTLDHVHRDSGFLRRAGPR